ncbi:MAG: hypothetical protein R3330_11995, partial [Saprospiraceae bacterium]|nr:hypothetical protein [Saprospiraceae bacterium]
MGTRVMNIVEQLRLRHQVPPELRSEFITRMDITSIDRQLILAWIGWAFYCLFLILDYRRWASGVFD